MLDSFNLAAANAAYQEYFNYYTEDGTFNGTDATENWDKKAFMAWAKPFFDKKAVVWKKFKYVKKILSCIGIPRDNYFHGKRMSAMPSAALEMASGLGWTSSPEIVGTLLPNVS